MHAFLHDLDANAVVSRHPHELTIVRDGRVAKVARAQWGTNIRAADLDGVPRWRHFHWLSGDDVAALELGDGPWLMAVRDHIEGRTLREAWLDDEQARSIALRLTYRVRDLHEHELFHGDLQPANVVVDPEGDVWLIDLAVLETRPGQSGHVAGSAALMAPELWEGAPPSRPADVYALGCLCCWLLTGRYPHQADDLAGWARAHREKRAKIEGLPTALESVIRRMLDHDPAARPQLQELIDALIAADVRADFTPTTAGGLAHLDLTDVVEAASRQNTHLAVFGPRGCGKSRAARRLKVEAARRRIDCVLLSGTEPICASSISLSDGPWASVHALAQAIGERRGSRLDLPMLGRGDRLHAFEQLTEMVFEAADDRPLLIVWDDFDRLRPDALAWWRHFRDAIDRRGASFSTVVLFAEDREVPAIRRVVEPVAPGSWSRWRAGTLRAEVRGLSQARWDQLVAEHGTVPGSFLGALDRELGARGIVGVKRQDWDTATLQSMRTGWRDRVAELSGQCAYAEIIEICEGLYRSLTSRGKADDDTLYDLFVAWTDATIGGGGNDLASALDTALRPHDTKARFGIAHARLLNALGRHDEGLAVLERAQHATRAQVAEIAGWRAQLALSAGRLEEARAHAEAGLVHVADAPPGVAAHLQVLQHAPGALRGDRDALGALAELATKLEAADVPHLLRARLHAYRAIGLGRADLLDEATDAHLRALEQIEQGGLSAELPTFLLNAGTAYHRQGRLGLAREYYARGLRIAQPTTRASTRALLFANQANVDLALGRLAEATELVQRGLEIARRGQLSSIEALSRSIAADIELARGDTAAARTAYLDILADEGLRLTPAQQAETRLSLAEAALQDGDPAGAAPYLDEARRMIEEHALDDLEHHHGILRARLQWAEGGELGTMAGIELFRRHLLAAKEAGNHRLVLRQSAHLSEHLEREGLDELLTELGDVVQTARNAVATGLGRDLRRDFFAQLPAIGKPTHRETARPETSFVAPTVRAPRSGPTYEPFYRMLSLNEVILHTERLDEMLPEALEIATTLSGAERGFILLRDESAGRVGSFVVAASRDVDGKRIPSPHLEVSLTIAEEAARTGRTVVTLNAREDGRFSQALSVVDLDLTSVLCVPVRDASGLLGALYVDHRFQPGVFEGEVPRMMEAFGHQLALAINNARRIAELQAERARLADAEAKLSELLRERESMLEGLEKRCAQLTDQVERAQSDATLRAAFPHIAYGSREMERVLKQVERVARGDIPVIVTGESGVGKELIARAVHEASPRRGGPFVAFNCGAVSESLFESEMFGHIKGAFTGADIDRQGLFMAANGGTIFLDEIGEMPLSMQVKLLRVLQERQLRRVGETQTRPIDVRVVAATNRDLAQMVAEETFREDLFYRLAAFVIEIPALRDRRDDIPLIAMSVLDRIAEESQRNVRLTPAGARLLRQCDWPGNVRELENTLRTAVVMADGEELGETELAPLVRIRTSTSGSTPIGATSETRGRRRKANRVDVTDAMRRAGDDRAKAAEILGVSERTLYRYLKRWDLY